MSDPDQAREDDETPRADAPVTPSEPASPYVIVHETAVEDVPAPRTQRPRPRQTPLAPPVRPQSATPATQDATFTPVPAEQRAEPGAPTAAAGPAEPARAPEPTNPQPTNPQPKLSPEAQAAREAAMQVAREKAAAAATASTPVYVADESREFAASTTESTPYVQEAPRVVYVEAPVAPRAKGVRGYGLLLVLAATVVYAIVYVILTIAIFFLQTGKAPFALAGSSVFVPVLLFFVGFALLVLLANRAKWWAYIIGSILVGLFVWIASVALILVLGGGITMSAVEFTSSFGRGLVDPMVIVAALLARETTMWTGWIISRRNARVQAAYAEALATHKAASQKRAPNGRSTAGNA